MENDPNKKDSKGKRLFKKAIRRNSKNNNNGSQQSAIMEQGVSVSRSKSFENKGGSERLNDSTPLPTPDGPSDKAEHEAAKHRAGPVGPSDEVKVKKIVDIQEARNEIFEEAATDSKKDSRSRSTLKLDKKSLEPESSRRGLKRVRLLLRTAFVLTQINASTTQLFLSYYFNDI